MCLWFCSLDSGVNPCVQSFSEMAGRNLRSGRTSDVTEIGDAVDSIRAMAAAVQQLVGSSRTTPKVHGQGE